MLKRILALLLLCLLFCIGGVHAQTPAAKTARKVSAKKSNKVSDTLKNNLRIVKPTDFADAPVIDVGSAKITAADCGEQNGSITDLNVSGEGLSYLWTKPGNGIFELRTKDLISSSSGTYVLVVSNETGQQTTAEFKIPEIKDQVMDFSKVVVVNAECGKSNGSITNIIVKNNTYPLVYSWSNQEGTQFASTRDLVDKPSGIYTLSVSGGPRGSCTDTYIGIIGNRDGLTIDTSRMQIVSSNCLDKSGSITGIRVIGVGKVKYQWTKSFLLGPPKIVGNEVDLKYQNAGTYQLKVTDESECGNLYTRVYTIKKATELLFDPSLVKVSKASCESYAAVTGIKEQQTVTGILHYEWKDQNGTIISNEANLIGVLGGKYTFTAQTICDTMKNGSFNAAPMQYGFDLGDSPTTYNATFRYTLKNSCLNQNTGVITIDAYPPFLQRFRWVNNLGDNIGEGSSLKDLGQGDYTLYVTDNLGCERLYNTFFIADIAPVQAGGGEVHVDTCNTKTGSITGVELVNGYPPFIYTWRDAGDKVVANTLNAFNLGAGDYTLTVSDGTGCEGPSKKFTVGNVDVIPPAPPINNIYICSSGEAVFRVISPNPNSSYRLYETESAYNAIDEQVSGEFKPKVITERKFYVSRLRGDCEGPRTEVDIKIGMIITDVTNTFTPNGDGVNDYWKINNVEKYTDALVQVFNRSGQMIFQSRGYAQPFNGTYNGKLLPSGVYYYVVTLDNGCRVSGNVTILR